MLKLKYLIVLTILCLGLIIGCRVTDTDEELVTSIQLRIGIDEEFTRLNIREAGASNWKISRTVTYRVGNHTVELYPSLNTELKYDIQLVTRDGRTVTKNDVMLTQNCFVDFEIKDFDDETAKEVRTINILNRTGIDFVLVDIGNAGSSSWTHEISGTFENEKLSTLTNITPKLDSTLKYNIRLRGSSTGNISSTRTDISVSQNGTVVFEAQHIN